jgi:hypothetical protein
LSGNRVLRLYYTSRVSFNFFSIDLHNLWSKDETN